MAISPGRWPHASSGQSAQDPNARAHDLPFYIGLVVQAWPVHLRGSVTWYDTGVSRCQKCQSRSSSGQSSISALGGTLGLCSEAMQRNIQMAYRSA